MNEEKLKRFIVRDFAIFYAATATILAIALRLAFIHFESGDYTYFQGPWYDHLASNPWLSGFAKDFSNYSPLYLYFIKVATLLPFSKVVSIKLISIAFDFLIAVYAAKLVRQVLPHRGAAALAYAAMLFTPTIFVNSSFWGQVDAAPAAFILASFYYLSRARYSVGFLMFGIAFAFKLQTLFVFPVLVGFYFVGNFRAANFLLIPLVYVISILPAWLGGGRLGTLLTVYFNQAGYYSELTKNAPNLYHIFSGDFTVFRRMGLALALMTALSIAALIIFKGRTITRIELIRLALLSALAMPFVLPQMHERYFYTADVLSVVYLLLERSRSALYVATTVVLASLFSYFPFLFTKLPPIPFPFLALLVLSAILVVGYEYVTGNTEETFSAEEVPVELGRS